LDGDGLGASLGLWHALKAAGVSCRQVYEPPVPVVFEFLPGADQRDECAESLPDTFNLAVVDCGALDRIGRLARHADRAGTIVNIDHHVSNRFFGDLNYVDCGASSCGELVYRLLKTAGVALTEEAAVCLYTAIVTDTGRFSYANTTAECIEICGALVRAGCNPAALSDRIYNSQPQSVVRLMGLAIGTLRLHAGERIGTVEITRRMFERTGTRPVDTQGFADIPLSVSGVVASALLKEMRDGPDAPWVKVSLRSRPSGNAVDVCAVAQALGGGGHSQAAGCELRGTLAEARDKVVGMLSETLEP